MSTNIQAQKLEVLLHVLSDGNSKLSSKKIDAKDSISAYQQAQAAISALHSEGYLTASIDSIRRTENSLDFYLNKGDQFVWAKLKSGNINEAILSKVGFRDKLYFGESFMPAQFSKLMSSLLEYYENNGYPFAEISLDSVKINEDSIMASLYVEKKTLLKVDSIIIKGNPPISEGFIHNYLNIYPGDVYNHALLMDISNKIEEIPFLKENKSFEIQYFKEKTKVFLYLDKEQASSFNGILGAATDEESQKLNFTGDVDLNLINAFHKGEKINFKWRSLNEQSQDLKFNFLYPFLLSTPLGLDFNFGLFKQDTSFINLETVLGLRYFLSANDYLKIFMQNKNSNLLSKQSYLTQEFSGLPPIIDSKVRLYGLEYSIERLNYRYNPSKGFYALANLAFGNKIIEKIPELEERNPGIYDEVKLRSQQYSGLSSLRYFIQISPRNTVMFANKSAVIFNENLFSNELMRIGGLQTLRGFDEESIQASMYSIFTLEYRFLLDRNSFLSLFSDAGYYENSSNETFVKDQPIGIGAGISFETAAGIFTLNYALGRQFENPFYFRSGKVHFGFINFF